jgi:hypothetical protein
MQSSNRHPGIVRDSRSRSVSPVPEAPLAGIRDRLIGALRLLSDVHRSGTPTSVGSATDGSEEIDAVLSDLCSILRVPSTAPDPVASRTPHMLATGRSNDVSYIPTNTYVYMYICYAYDKQKVSNENLHFSSYCPVNVPDLDADSFCPHSA